MEPISALQLRALIRNDEAIVEHLAALLEGGDGVVDALPTPAGYPREREAMLTRLGDAIRRLQRRRNALETFSRPTSRVEPGSGHAPQAATSF